MSSVSPQRFQNISPKRAEHLERNRIAANKYRERKKLENKQIERRLSDVTEKKDLLVAQLNCLREELWGLKNLIFQHAKCDHHQVNAHLAKMAQTVLGSQIFLDSPPYLGTSSSPSTSSDKPVGDETNMIAPGAYDGNDWTVLPKVANDVVPYEPNGLTDLLFENFINKDNLYP